VGCDGRVVVWVGVGGGGLGGGGGGEVGGGGEGGGGGGGGGGGTGTGHLRVLIAGVDRPGNDDSAFASAAITEIDTV